MSFQSNHSGRWAGGGADSIEKILKEIGIEIARSPLTIKYLPDENEIKHWYEYGRDFANKLEE